jgi:hypothetical protein
MTDREHHLTEQQRWKAAEARMKAIKEGLVAACWAVFLVALVAGLVKAYSLLDGLGR